MDVKNLSWEQIKELAEIAMKNGSDFSLTLCADGDCSLDISKHDYRITPIATTTPISGINIGDEPNNPYKITC